MLGFFAWRALAADDRLGTLVVVQLFGLLASPISWSHHWVWVLPMAIWLLHGPYRERLGARLVAGYWLAATLVGVPWLLSFAQDSIWVISRPGGLAWLGAVYPVGVIAFYLLLIGYGRRGVTAPAPPGRSVRPEPRPSAVRPPSECVDSTSFTLRQRMSMSGWWSAASARSATRRTNSIAVGKLANSIVRVISSPSRVQSGMVVSACSSSVSVSFAMGVIVVGAVGLVTVGIGDRLDR